MRIQFAPSSLCILAQEFHISWKIYYIAKMMKSQYVTSPSRLLLLSSLSSRQLSQQSLQQQQQQQQQQRGLVVRLLLSNHQGCRRSRSCWSSRSSTYSFESFTKRSLSTTTTTNITTTTTTNNNKNKENRPPKHAMLSQDDKVKAPPMVYISGEEMTQYASNLIVQQWLEPYFDLSAWERYDLSCHNRDATNDDVLHQAVQAGKRIGAIFKEPTITPTTEQMKAMKLTRSFGSPNGAMRRGWNGITISRDTIHIEGIQLGYRRPVYFERHAVGGEYSAGWNQVGEGTLLTTYMPKDGSPPFIVDKRDLKDDHNVVVVYDNPYDNVVDLAHLFFQRCWEGGITPYIVTKKTVFKWQEGFWSTMKQVFDEHYQMKFEQAGLLERSGGKLQHLISDAATMQLIRWTDGGFGMAAHNYDGDMLTDQIAQVHRSPGFITSNLVGKNDDGSLIKEFEASHGTVSDLWQDHLAGKETSLNPLGLVEAIIGAMRHSAVLNVEWNKAEDDTESAKVVKDKIFNYTETLRNALHNTFRYGQGTRDMTGPSGFSTEDFIAKVAWRLDRYLTAQYEETPPPKLSEPSPKFRRNYDIDEEEVAKMFARFDINRDGYIDYEEFTRMLIKMNVAPHRASKLGPYEKQPDV